MKTRKVLVITGTTSGVGRYLAQDYLDKGFIVVGCGRRDPRITHSNYTHFVCDLRYEKSVIDFVKNIVSKHRKIDVLINNAGYDKRYHTTFMPFDTATEIMGVNFMATFLMCREVAKIMIRQKQGRIINLTSIAVPLLIEGESIYAASKSAVDSFTKILAKELYRFNITVNAVGPSFLETEMTEDVPEEKKRLLISRLTTRKQCSFEDIAYAIDFFINDDNSSMTGQIIYTGGIS